MAKKFVLLISSIFFLYGLLFIVFPQEVLQFVVQGKMSTSSGVIDLRATYGGMALGIGLILYILAIEKNTLQVALLAVFLLMTGMALGRIVGMVIDGEPNQFMYVYLALELFSCVLSLFFLKVSKE